MEHHLIREASEDSIFGGLSAEEYYRKHGVVHYEEFMTNARGMKIFTQKWEAAKGGARGAVLALHGFSVDSSWLLQLTAIGIAKRGFTVHAMDFEGHGRSQGLVAHIPCLASAAEDCAQLAAAIAAQEELPLFVYAESMGAAVALLCHLRQPALFSGMVLHGAMCGISKRFLPPRPILLLSYAAAKLLPTWRPRTTPDNVNVSYKEHSKRALVRCSPSKAVCRPDAATGYNMMCVAEELQARAHEVHAPLLLVHGDEDRVCDLESVQAFFASSPSPDKSLKVYPGMRHMFVGESDDLIDVVFHDILCWLEERAPRKP